MKKEEKEIIKHLIKKEMNLLKKEESKIEFPQLNFLKSADEYERELKRMLDELK
ncbi:MAG: hypothetical protein AABX17_02030 [Nanoarchaeota archaeon]